MLLDSSLPKLEPFATAGGAVLPAALPSWPMPTSPSELRRREAAHVAGQVNTVACSGLVGPLVEISPAYAATRRAVTCGGMIAEIVETRDDIRAEYHFNAPVHLLAVWEQGVRRAGETFVDGLPRSGLKDRTGRTSFVPANHAYHDWHEAQGVTRIIFVYFDPAQVSNPDVPMPRLFFEDAVLLALALNLGKIVERSAAGDASYLQALALVLARELCRLDQAASQADTPVRGGLAAWQQRVVAAHIEEHLAEPISLSDLAELARLSTYHFARAFKRSFGVPPHRFHVTRRIERAMVLLVESAMSVTEIGLTVGFSETSAFTATFRKLTGFTPTAYSRSRAAAPC